MDRRDGRKPADSGRNVDPAMRIVLLSMECSRLRGQIDVLISEKDQMAVAAQETEVLRKRVDILEATLESRNKSQGTSYNLANEVTSLRTELRRKDQELMRLQSETKVAVMNADEQATKASYSDSLVAKLEEMRGENQKLNKEVLELRLQADEAIKLKRENSNLNTQLDDFLRSRTDNRVDSELLKDYSTRIVTLESDNGHLRARLQELLDRENEHIYRQETITGLESRLRGLLQEHEEHQTLISKFKTENSKLNADCIKLAQYEESIHKLIEENDRLTSVLTSMKSSINTEASAELLKANQSLKLQVDSLKLELDRTKTELKDSSERIKSLNNHCSLKIAEASQLEVVLAENARLAEVLTDLKKQSTGHAKDKEELKLKLTVAEDSLKDCQKSLKDKIFSLEDQLSTANHKLKQQSLSLDNLEKSNTLLTKNNSDFVAAEEKVRKLTGETESLRRINEDLKQFNSSLNEQVSFLRQELSRKEGVDSSLKGTIEEVKYLATSKDNLELKLKTTVQQLGAAEKQLEETHSEIEKLTTISKSVYALKAEADKYRGLYLESEDKLKGISELETKIDILQSQNRGLFDTNSELRKALMNKETYFSKPPADTVLTSEEAKRLKTMVQELDMEHSLLKEREVGLKSQVNQLNGKLRCMESLEAETSVLRNENLGLKAEKEDLMQEVKRLRNEMMKEKEHQGKYLEDYDDKRILKMELEAKKMQLTELEGRFTYAETEKLKVIAELRSKVTELTNQNEGLQETLNEEQLVSGRQKRELEELRDKVAILEKLSGKYDRISAQLLEKESILADYQRRIEHLDLQKASAGQHFEVRLHEANDEKNKYAAKEAALQRDLEDKTAKLQNLKEENLLLKANEARRRLLEDEVARLQAALTETRQRLDDQRLASASVNQLQVKQKTADDDNESLRRRISELVTLMDKMRSLNLDLELKNKTIPALQAKLELLEDQNREKEASLNELKSQLSATQRATKEKIDVERGEEKRLAEKMNELESAGAQRSHKIQNLTLEIESLRLENNHLKTELAASEDLLVEIQRQAKENHALIAEQHSLASQKEQLAMRVAKYEQEVLLYKEKLGEALLELERVPMLESDLRRRQQENGELQSRITELMRSTDAMRSKMVDRESELVSMHLKTDKNRQALVDISMNNLHAELKALENDRNGWKSHAQKLEKSLGQQEQETQRRIQLVNVEKTSLLKQLKETKQERQDHEVEIKQLLAEIEGYRRKVDLLEFKLRECYAKMDRFEELIEQSKVQTTMAAGKNGASESILAHENKKLADNLRRTTDELAQLKHLAERQAEDLRTKAAEVFALRQKLAT